MGPIPFALSIHNFVHSVGADAGFASIIGLAVLVLLYFAQARETATLRERLSDSADRVGMLENRVAQLSRAQVPAAPPVVPRPASAGQAPAAVGAAVAARAVAVASATPSRVPPDLAPLPGAPAGLAAPALTSATKLIPGPALVPGRAETPAAVPSPATVPAPVPVGRGAAPDDTVLVAPMTVAAGANGHKQTAGSMAPPPVSASPAAPPPRVAIRRDAGATLPPRRTIPPVGPPASRERSLGRRLLPVLIGIGAVAVAVVALLVITGSGGTTRAGVHGSAHKSSHSRRSRTAASAVIPGDVSVVVLNGTAINNVAHDIAVRLTGAGYKQGATPTNAASQTFTKSVVAYTPGHAAAADAVARTLKLSAHDVQPANQEALGVACPPTTPAVPCTAEVIVTVGADLASTSASAPAG